MINKEQILNLLWEEPIQVGRWVGFKKLTSLHNDWLRSFLYEDDDQTLQGHRGSYKTTVLSLFFALHIIENPNETILYFRKTDTDVEEISRQTINILTSGCVREIVRVIYGKELALLKSNNSEINTNLSTSNRGTSQIVGLGIGTSITGKHADIVVTDDIVNVKDRISEAERKRTKIAFMELQNIKNRGGRFINTGTPWHKDDAFSLMSNIKKYDCYSTGLISEEDLEKLKEGMSPSLFAANYELRHIASENVIFNEREMGASERFVYNAICHIDAAYDGEDWTAFGAMAFREGKFYLYGRTWRKHVEDCYDQILDDYKRLMLGKCYMEKNADKGFVARDLKSKGMRTVSYSENTNKHIKITTYLKGIWKDVILVEGTDPEYIQQILDYNEDAEHDDCPDDAACLARLLYRKAKRDGYSSILDSMPSVLPMPEE